MTEEYLARFLIEDVGAAKVDPKIKVLTNRVSLQIFNVPSLQSYLVKSGIVTNQDGSSTIQLDFLRLPEEILPQVERVISADGFDDFTWSRYIKDGQAHTGLELTIHPENIPGDNYDYAY